METVIMNEIKRAIFVIEVSRSRDYLLANQIKNIL